jgi:CheY-like chemotaxis protein
MNKSLLKKVLIVDDQEENRQNVKEALKKFDVEIIEAENGKEAVELFMQHPLETFDLITMDYLMPELNGAQAVMRIRALDKIVPIICISASIKMMRPQLLHFDHLYFLDKPLDSNEFIQILSEIQSH